MNKEKALQLVDSVVAQFRGTREEHIKLQEAMTLLREVENTEPKKDK